MTVPGIYNIKALPSWKFIEKCDDAVTNRNGQRDEICHPEPENQL